MNLFRVSESNPRASAPDLVEASEERYQSVCGYLVDVVTSLGSVSLVSDA
jgi:hypothetical protein